MKILCVIDYLGSGGAQRQLVNLAIGFKEKGHNVSFLVYHRGNFYEPILKENDIPIHKIIEPNYFKRLMKMRRYIRKGNFDAVLSFLEAANFICEIAGLPKRKWKLVVGERSANPKIFKSAKLRIYRWFHLLADHVVANSYENIKMVRKINPLLSKKKCHVIYNMIDFEKWKPSEIYEPLNNDKFKIVVVASHRYLKNLNGLIEAVNILCEEEKNKLQIDWYGENSLDDSLQMAQNKIREYNLSHIFNFYQPILDIHKKVQEADAVGLFSFYEGLPNTICEAMASGKPVIASKVSDIPLLIDEQFTFDPTNYESISKIISMILNMWKNELEETGKKNQKNALTLFNKENTINNYLSLLMD
jgi:glycosyltransferase involved in cell wall biosynthesis